MEFTLLRFQVKASFRQCLQYFEDMVPIVIEVVAID
jgi:hypothetical protein